MSKKDGIYKNVVFTTSLNKKELDKGLEIDDNKDMNKQPDKKEFTTSTKAYVHYFNTDLKKFEMFTILIDASTGETKLERKVMEFDNEPRAIMEMQKLYSQDYIEKLKRK